MNIFDHPHEQVVFCRDEAAGLEAIIAIHSTRLGPALGGARMFDYASEEDALKDVLRLSQAMTYKAAVAGLPMGGGKAVILGNPLKDKTHALFRALGRYVENLGGRYITAEDSGTTQDDMALIATETRHVTGTPRADGKRGDASEATALGVFLSMKVAHKECTGSEDLKGVRVAIQGMGSIGTELAKLLSRAGAKLMVSDVHVPRVEEAARLYGAQIVDPREIHAVAADIFAPCALGGVLNDETIPRIQAKAVVGAANNQLLDSVHHSAMLAKHGILYGPDYVVNAGGIIKLFLDMKAGTPEAGKVHLEQIADTLRQVFAMAKEKSCTTEEAAMEIARRRLGAGPASKS